MAKPEKTVCPLTKKQFADKAQGLKVTINGREFLAPAKQFSTGSFGWYINDKVTVEVDGKAVQVQVGMNLIVVGSKEAKDE